MRPPTECWNVQAELEPLLGGHRNRAFRTLSSTTEEAFVFKSTRRSEAALAWLSAVHAAAEKVGFLVPSLFRSRAGNLIEDGWICEPFLEGSPFTSDDLVSIRPQIDAFHAATVDFPQRPGFLSSQDLIEQTRGGDVDFGAMPPSLVDRCRTSWSAVAGQKEAVIHGDINPGNLIRCVDGRIALIDWDECRRDLVLFDKAPLGDCSEEERFALLAWEVACSWHLEPDYARRLASSL